jgi:hypothetical protein
MHGGLKADALMDVAGCSWDEEVMTGESFPSWARTRRKFIGFRLVRQST